MKQLLAVLTLFCSTVYGTTVLAQPTIVGRIIDATSKEAVIGARITFDPEYLSDTAKAQLKGRGAISKSDGSFELATLDTGAFVLEIKQPGYEAGYIEFASRVTHTDTLYAQLERVQNNEVVVSAKATMKTIEDLCCRVEELNAELTNVASFTPDMQQVMSRYSSCTSYHINCTLDHSSTVRLRGMENPYTLMLLDGVPLFSAITTQYGMQMIPALATDNARIIEGASTSVYGNNAMAGVLSFDMKQPTLEREAFIQTNLASSASHGLEGAYDLNGSYRNGNERTGVALVASFNKHPVEVGTESIFGEAPGLSRYSGYLSGFHKIGESTKLKFMALAGLDDRDVRIAATDSTRNGDHRVKTDNFSLIGRLENSLSDLTALTITGAMAKASHAVSSQVVSISPLSYAPPAFAMKSDIYYGQAIMTTATGDHFITAGSELRYEDATGELPGALFVGALFASPRIYDFTTISAFAEDQISLAEQWTLLIGGRLDQHSSAGIAVSPRGSVSFRPSADWRLRVMAGQGVKGQALFNEDHRIMHGQYGYEYNDDFDYEKSLSLNYDMSYTYTVGDQIGGVVNFNAFYSNITNKATAQADSLANGKIFFVNSNEPARLMGIEVQTRPSFSENWSGSLAFSVINLTQVNASGARERVPLSPTVNVDASLMYHDHETETSGEVWGSIIGSQRLPENPYAATSPMIGMVNFRMQKELGMFTIHAGVLNILDAEQTDTMPLAFTQGNTVNTTTGWGPMEGREFFLGVRVSL